LYTEVAGGGLKILGGKTGVGGVGGGLKILGGKTGVGGVGGGLPFLGGKTGVESCIYSRIANP
jgi:hypothetical protein